MGDQSIPTNNSSKTYVVSEDNIICMSSPAQDINQSLGILSLDIESSATVLGLSSRRKSLPYQDNQDSLGKESLDKSVVYLENSDVGRESLGILQLDQLDVNLGYEKSPEIVLSPSSTNINDNELLDNDLVFIECNHLAQKIADGSFINDVPEHGILDCTPQPDWPHLDDSEMSNKDCPKQNIETVFKTIDKLFPTGAQPVLDSNHKRSKSDATMSVSKNPKEILQNLSQIFNSSHRSHRQKVEGRILINCLADLLDNSQTDKDCNDSGHSSITEYEVFRNNGNECNQVLNITNSIKSTAGSRLIEKENSFNLKKRPKQRLQSLGRAVEKLQKPIKKNSVATGSNIQKVTTKEGANVDIKLKSKPQNSRVKEAPVKAVIPVEHMKKTKKYLSLNSSVKKISTPINEPKMKPMATSTPDMTPKSAQQNFPPARINSNSKNKLSNNDSSKKADLVNSSKGKGTSLPKTPLNDTRLQGPFRRNSVTEGMVENQPKRNRSNSLGQETGIMSSLRKVRENLLKSPYYNKKTGILIDSNIKIDETKERQRKCPPMRFQNCDMTAGSSKF